jgi:hypothetical protein
MCPHCKLLFGISFSDTVSPPAAATEGTGGNTLGKAVPIRSPTLAMRSNGDVEVTAKLRERLA